MFRKIVSNLSFSPALVGQLSFYAKRLKKEESTRRLGLIFVALALVVQGIAVFQPPESANASNAGDFIPGGLGLGSNRSLNNFIAPYDANARNLQDVMNYVGITRSEIVNAQYGYFIVANHYGWDYAPRVASTPVNILNSEGKVVTTQYPRPLKTNNPANAKIYAWIGHSAKAGWFAIMQACGNLVTDTIPTPPPAHIVQSKTAVNVSQGNVLASTVAAKENDKISFTISVKNTGGTAAVTKLDDHLADTLEYSTLIDQGGGTFDSSTKVLSWPDVNLAPGETQSRSFGVQVLSSIPATPVGQSDPTSYNCLMENAFGTAGITIPVVCAPPKVIETVTTPLPHTGPTENILFAGIVLAVVTFFFFRSKQMGAEVRLIRRDLNAGTI